MKNFLVFLLVFLFFVASFFIIGEKHEQNANSNKEIMERRAVFLSYLEFNSYIKNNNEEMSKKNIDTILNNLKDNGFNMLIVHVRPFSDAIYKSNIYPISDTVKVNGENPSYDVLSYIIQESKKRNIEVHAWINPYRISNDTNLDIITKENPAYNLVQNGCVKTVEDKGIFYNPACSEVSKLIVDGIKELVRKYPIDGIHFDDYFYPDADIDVDNYKEYIENGGTLSISDFRYKKILSLIKMVYQSIKSINKDVEFGISPEGNINNNYKKNFLDVKKILSEDGYIDYIMPQIYFGFDNSTKPFVETINEWNNLIKVDSIKLIPALAFYKVGRYDKYAGEGRNEWIENNNIISREVEKSRNMNRYSGFSLFRYDYLFNEDKFSKTSLEEFNNLIEIIK